MRHDEQHATGGPETGARRHVRPSPPPRLIRVRVPEAVALLGLPGPKALRRLLADAGVRLWRSGLGEPVIRGADLRALTARQAPSERAAYAALERVLLRMGRGQLLLHRDLVAEIRRDFPDVERAEGHARAVLRAVGFAEIEGCFYFAVRAGHRELTTRVRKLIALVRHRV